jgi:hypothetical protein
VYEGTGREKARRTALPRGFSSNSTKRFSGQSPSSDLITSRIVWKGTGSAESKS